MKVCRKCGSMNRMKLKNGYTQCLDCHNARSRAYHRALNINKRKILPNPIDRLNSNVMPIPESGCLIWMGAIRGNYGVLKIAKSRRYVHRLSYEQAYGRIPDGLMVCHHCDVPLCINPNHLFAGTNSDNQMDASRKGRKKHSLATRLKISETHRRNRNHG